MTALIIFLAVALVVVGFVAWMLLDDSMVRVDPGHLGLVLFKGAPTDKVLLPGPHFVPTFRRKSVQVYPSLELSYRAGEANGAAPEAQDRSGPALVVTLGDRTISTVDYTVRFRLDPAQIRQVHERFGPDGIWAAVRDRTGVAIRNALSDEQVGVDDLFGPRRRALEAQLGETVSEALAADGLSSVLFALGDTDLGWTGEVIQATARARYDLARELAEADTRQARARHDTEVEGLVSGSSMEAALRYREVDAWREVALVQQRGGKVPGPVPRPYTPGTGSGDPAVPPPPADPDETTTR